METHTLAQLGRDTLPAFSAEFLPSSSAFFPFRATAPPPRDRREILVVHSPQELVAYRNARPRVQLPVVAVRAAGRTEGGAAAADSTGASASESGTGAGDSVDALTHAHVDRSSMFSRRRRISLVPTMGGLHEGHLHLIRGAACTGDEVWVTIFVNALQFHSAKDFLTYPASIDDDMKLLSQVRVDLVFIPSHSSLYPLDSRPHLIAGSEELYTVPRGRDNGDARANGLPNATDKEADRVVRSPVSGFKLERLDTHAGERDALGPTPAASWIPPQRLFRMRVDFEGIEEVEGEGRRRSGFLRGIGTVVTQLFTLIRPTYAHFGFKDFQQVACVKRLICGMGLDALLLAHNTWRDSDGMAASSRNRRMTEEDRKKARKSFLLLQHVGEIFRKGERRVHALLEAARAFAEKEKLLLHYTTIDRLEDGEPVVYRHTSGAVKRLGACCGEEETAERRAKRRREGEKADGAEDGTEGGPPAAGCHVDRHEVSLNGTRAAPSSKGTDFDMSLLDSGRYCLTVAVRGNPLTTVVDSVFLVPSNRDDLLPPPFNTPWDHHCVEPKYACLPSFVLFSSFGFHLRRLRPADVRVIAAAEAEDAQLERGHLKSPASSAEGVCCAPSFAWMNERALAKTSTQDVWALGVFKRRLGTSRNTVDESDPAVPEGNEALVGYAWADAETPPDATAPGASPAPWRLRRVFITRVRRRRTFGTHLVKAFLATLYKEKVSRSPTASREVVGDPMPAWFAPVARECGFSLMEATALTSGMCRMRLNLDHWFRVFVTELDL